MRRVIVETDEGTRHEYSVPRSVRVNVQETERVRAGDPLIDGPIDPHDVLSVLGIKELQRYLVDKIQEVYRSQSVAINDKHIEVICRQMLRSVRVTRVGDTDFLVDEQVDRFRFMEENEKVMNRGGEPADGTPLLLGITKASLSTESFISAASFQETTRVLTEAADRRPSGLSTRPEGKRHRRPANPRRHRHADLSRHLHGERGARPRPHPRGAAAPRGRGGAQPGGF